MFQLSPHLWGGTTYTLLDVTPQNRSVIVNFCLHQTTILELIIVQHKAPSLDLSLLSIQIYCREPQYGFDIRKFSLSLPEGRSSHIFKLRITKTSI